MALKMTKLFGETRTAENTDFDVPTTQVRMNITSPEGFDPLASMSVMEQLRTASDSAPPPRLPIIGRLPVVRQFQILGVVTIAFLALAVFMVYLDNRASSQQALQAAAATEMQMLSQRLARGSALAAQGQAAAFAAIRDSRDRFQGNLDALLGGGMYKGANLDPTQGAAPRETLNGIKGRWERVEAAAKRLVDNEKSLTSLASGLAAINQGNSGLLELAQQASQQIGQAGGTLREVDYANQLAVLSQRIAKNANALAAADEIDPEVAFLLGKDDATFRDIVSGLAKGSDALRLSPARSDDSTRSCTSVSMRVAPVEPSSSSSSRGRSSSERIPYRIASSMSWLMYAPRSSMPRGAPARWNCRSTSSSTRRERFAAATSSWARWRTTDSRLRHTSAPASRWPAYWSCTRRTPHNSMA
jgi:hypothetical protein